MSSPSAPEIASTPPLLKKTSSPPLPNMSCAADVPVSVSPSVAGFHVMENGWLAPAFVPYSAWIASTSSGSSVVDRMPAYAITVWLPVSSDGSSVFPGRSNGCFNPSACPISWIATCAKSAANAGFD